MCGCMARVMMFFCGDTLASSGVSSPILMRSFTSEWSSVTNNICVLSASLPGRMWYTLLSPMCAMVAPPACSFKNVMVVPIFFEAPLSFWSRAWKASATAFSNISSVNNASLLGTLAFTLWLIASHTVALATSPASCPPMPSHRMKRRSASVCLPCKGYMLSSW